MKLTVARFCFALVVLGFLLVRGMSGSDCDTQVGACACILQMPTTGLQIMEGQIKKIDNRIDTTLAKEESCGQAPVSITISDDSNCHFNCLYEEGLGDCNNKTVTGTLKEVTGLD